MAVDPSMLPQSAVANLALLHDAMLGLATAASAAADPLDGQEVCVQALVIRSTARRCVYRRW